MSPRMMSADTFPDTTESTAVYITVCGRVPSGTCGGAAGMPSLQGADMHQDGRSRGFSRAHRLGGSTTDYVACPGGHKSRASWNLAPARVAQTCNCSPAAARKVSPGTCGTVPRGTL